MKREYAENKIKIIQMCKLKSFLDFIHIMFSYKIRLEGVRFGS